MRVKCVCMVCVRACVHLCNNKIAQKDGSVDVHFEEVPAVRPVQMCLRALPPIPVCCRPETRSPFANLAPLKGAHPPFSGKLREAELQ